MTIARVIAELERKKAELAREITKAEAETIKEAKARAIMLSSGPFTTRQLREFGHPYAQRDPRARFPGVINAQTGAFRAAWFTTWLTFDRGVARTSLINADRVADFMKGTELMITRPILQQVATLIIPGRIVRIQKAIDKVMNT